MAEIYRYAFPRSLFDQAPEGHRFGYLMLGQLWNDCIILTRQLLTARNQPPEGRSDLDLHGQIVTELVNLRFLAGRLHEGAALLRKLGTFSRTWEEEVTPDAVEAAKRVKRYFATSSAPLSRLRHKLGFHQDEEVARAALGTISDEELIDYHGEYYATTLYMSAQALDLRALSSLLGTTAREALNILSEDAISMLGDTNVICQAYHSWFLLKYIVPHHPLGEGQRIHLDGVPDHDAIVVPFFVSFDKVKATLDARSAGAVLD
ncbi:MAG TPA: hypothetical protein VH331_14775 [Allosphingosinicella sp.]|jgi:hypothetical protein|nr:hypothetical protein [Allosphingosinicella sp.]